MLHDVSGDYLYEQVGYSLGKQVSSDWYHEGLDVLPFTGVPTRDAAMTAGLVVAITALLFRILSNRRLPLRLPNQLDILVLLKILCGHVYVVGSIILLVYAEEPHRLIFHSAGIVTAIAFTGASISEHYYSTAPSTLTCIFAIFGTTLYGSLFFVPHKMGIPSVYLFADAAVALSLFALVFLESKNKRRWLIPTDPPPAYESTLAFLVKPFFPHIIPILYTGYRRRITLPELHDIPLHLRSDPATEQLLAALATEDKTSTWYLAKSTFKAFRGNFLSPIFPRLLVLAGTFVQVALVEQLILYVTDKSIPKERGTLLIAVYFVVYVTLAIANYSHSEKVNAFIVLYRSALTGCLYAKTLRLTSMAAREIGQGAATTYMSVDVEKATSGFQTMQELWAAVATIIIACTMLWYKAGLVMFAPLLFIVTLIASTIVTWGSAQKRWLAAMDIRIQLFTSVLGQLLPIKLGAYEDALSAKITALRMRETAAYRSFLYYINSASTLSNIGPSASFLVTLAAYTVMRANGWGNLEPLDVSRIFTLFTIVSLLNAPLNMIGQSLPSLFASFASLGRIQRFLQLPEKAVEADTAEEVEGDMDGTSRLDTGFKQSSVVEVSLDKCTFAWDDKTPVLRDITLELAPRELHMVVGSVASGKSSLLMSILQETILVGGSMTVKAQKAYRACDTNTVHLSRNHSGQLRRGVSFAVDVLTLKLAVDILLDSAYDEVFYGQVINACGLRQDIDALPRRDMTKLGDKGTTLSGGQRQRLAIARAVYARADLVLLDDVFSALDGETEAHVFASLFGQEGLLKGKTTVLVTHGVHHLPSADKVIVMDAGMISHFGSFEEVRDAGATFALATSETDAGSGGLAVKAGATAVFSDNNDEDEEQQWVVEQSSRMGAYAFYIKCTGVIRAYGMFLLIAIWSGSAVLANAYLSILASTSRNHFGLWVAGYGALVAVDLSLLAVTLICFAYIISTFTATHIHTAELAGVMRSPISWITKTPIGKILNRFSQDLRVSDEEFPYAFLNFAANIISMSSTFLFITLATPLVAVALPFLAVFGTYFLRFYLATSKQFRRLEAESKSPLYTLFGSTVSGLVTVRAFGAQDFFRSQNAAFVNESQGALHHRVGGQLFLRVFLLWFQAIIGWSVALLAVRMRNTTAAAFLGLALARLVTMGASLAHLLNSFASMENGSISIDRIEEFAKLPTEEKITVVNDPPNWPSAGSLTFSNFSMKYRDDLPLALKNLSFDVPGGLKIGICGRTGSGKSSTVLALFRGIDQQLVNGKISIDGVDISTVSLKHLRESMSIVTQDPFLWHGSIRENLDVTNACTDSEIWETLKLVEMYDAISTLHDKLDHLIVDEESFSKGQRQLLCLARALLRKKKIIVLDESTSSMDHLTDEKIRHVVDTQMGGLTVLTIAHRISTIVNYNKILVLDSGSIVEFDDPQVLLSNPDSRFARLAATQGIYHPDTVPTGAAVKELGDGMAMVVTEDLIEV
ncbi:hypothetical protein MSAN_01077100 [Mycena sanguinolenta]|uniref:P-loop containing nucleoside triphosphate hydrolase protein n=1 Tax=Mycena sanguinolenta TaxID=230812 RepID=A0A8H6YQ67_9AGAR|nr:hypothetical protein MSAN_01077100 [Mycena sanguinolenta]